MPKSSLYLDRLTRGAAALAVALTAFLVLDPTLASAGQRLEVTGLRIGVHSDMTRVVLDVSGNVPFLATPVGDGSTVIVEIPGVTWKTNSHRSIGRGLIRNYEYEVIDGSNLLALSTTGPVSVERAFTLGPSGSGGHRIVIDLVVTGDYPETSMDETVVGTVNQEQLSADNDTALFMAGTDEETLSVSVTEVAQLNQSQSVKEWLQQEQQNLNLKAAQDQLQRIRTLQANSSVQQAATTGEPNVRPSPYEVMGGDEVFDVINDGKGFYVAARFGLALQQDFTAADDNAEAEVSPDVFGFIGAGALGVNLGRGLRLEGEVSYSKSDLDKTDITGTGSFSGLSLDLDDVDGSVSTLSFMANGAFEFTNNSAFTPYVMGGLGGAIVSISDWKTGSVEIAEDDDDFVFAYQLGAGINLAIDERVSFDLEYRYFATTDPTFTDVDADYDAEFSSHNVMLGMRYKL